MKSVSRIALGVALVLGGASVVATAPAEAQKKKKNSASAAQPGQKQIKLTKEERTALQPVHNAVTAKNWAAAAAALPAAQAAMTSADGRYAFAHLQLQIGLNTNNTQMQAEAVDALLASGFVPATELPLFYRNQAVLANTLGNRQKAETAFARVIELSPNDTDALVSLAKVKSDLRKPQEAVALLQRAIEVKRGAGQVVDESWYKYALRLAYDGKMRPQAIRLSRDLVGAYPSKENWRDALLIYRELGGLDAAAQLDVLRLMRASRSLSGERDWYELAYEAQNAGLFGEAKAVLDEGARLKMIDLNKVAFRELATTVNRRIAADRASLAADESRALADPTGRIALKLGDAYAGHGDYAKAISLYRAALGKPGVDAGAANIRLGAALAAAGNRAEAQAAFRAVTGPRADLAAFWLAWLARAA